MDHLVSYGPSGLLLHSSWSQDLFLMGHFMSKASQTLTDSPRVARVLRDRAQEESLRYPFLMHGMLAHSALHLSATLKEEKLRFARLCRHHMILGIPEFRSTLASMDQSSRGPCFLMAMLLGSQSMASLSENAPSDVHGAMPEVTYDTIVAFCSMLQGMMGIQGPPDRQNEDYPYSINVRTRGMKAYDAIELPETIQFRYGEIKAQVSVLLEDQYPAAGADPSSSEEKQKDLEAYLAAIELTVELHKEILAHEATSQDASGDAPNEDESWTGFDPYFVARWAARVSSHYIGLLKRKDRAAVLTLMNYIDVVELVEDQHWTLRGWGANSRTAIRNLGV